MVKKMLCPSLHPYQMDAVNFVLQNKKAALFMGMGLGKTLCVLTAIDRISMLDGKPKVLIVAPYMVSKFVWEAEISKWGFNLLATNLVANEKQRDIRLQSNADVFIINVENLTWLLSRYDIAKLVDMLIIDESSMFKDSKSKRFKELRKVSKDIDRVILLSGTPCPNSLEELWPQMFLLDQGERLGRSKRTFLDEYFRPGLTSGYVVYNYLVKKGSKDRIYSKISDIALSIKTDGLIDLPEYQEIDFEVRMEDKLKKGYEVLKKELCLEVGDEEMIDAMNAAVLIGKLQQYANGMVYGEDRKVHTIHDIKIRALKEIVEFSDGALIFYWYKHERDEIRKALGIPDLNVEEWNSGKQKFAMLHPASGGHGLNLQHGGNIMVWFSPIYSLELYQQSVARLYRQGQTRAVRCYRIIMKGTIDDQILKVLSGKKRVQDALLSALQR